MTTITVDRKVALEVFECNGCHIMYGVPAGFLDDRRRTGDVFYCPNGCQRVYRENEADRLRTELAKQAKQLEQAETVAREYREQARSAERRLTANRGVITRMKNRAANGVCPCCNRSFEDLRRHMTTKHPDFKNEEEPPCTT
jgi:hypothetical protein